MSPRSSKLNGNFFPYDRQSVQPVAELSRQYTLVTSLRQTNMPQSCRPGGRGRQADGQGLGAHRQGRYRKDGRMKVLYIGGTGEISYECARRDVALGREVAVLVDQVEEGVPVGRSYREAPEIDGMILLDRGEPGEWLQARITGSYGADTTAEVIE